MQVVAARMRRLAGVGAGVGMMRVVRVVGEGWVVRDAGNAGEAGEAPM